MLRLIMETVDVGVLQSVDLVAACRPCAEAVPDRVRERRASRCDVDADDRALIRQTYDRRRIEVGD
jgi:hypothetical protein